ncbi:glycosyltransferase family 32 protein [Irpex rosettiformis]|uniref:Glycosyltransferase family 32 protein n=1 Tax=Irpex rosettiformis TaxID=378272 RepID=A0ACB8TZR6_9APHY|nr:glycosyltransferase family 32 protein [Irpex rosettiformis]
MRTVLGGKEDGLPQWRSWPRDTRPSHWRLRRRHVFVYFRLLLPIFLLSMYLFYLLWQPHVELSFYSRSWIRDEVETLRPLSGCFDEHRISQAYNMTRSLHNAKKTEVHSGLPMRMGMDCYNFAGTIQDEHAPSSDRWIPPQERTQYHTYWRNDLVPFGERQEWMIKSFFATQNLNTAHLILWSNGDLTGNELVRKWMMQYPDAFTVKLVDMNVLSKGTSLQDSDLLWVKDKKAWVDGDLIRLLVLWTYGGVWVDMDSLLTRDLHPLLEHEFVTQWDCYDKVFVPFNGALMNFHKHSPYLCEAFHIMATSPSPRIGTTDWGATLYLKLWRRLLDGRIPPFKVLPFCFSDGRSCRLDNRLPDPFAPDPKNGGWTMGMGREEGGGLDHVLANIFSVHLHNQWDKRFPKDGWVYRLLLRRYDRTLKGIKPRTFIDDEYDGDDT